MKILLVLLIFSSCSYYLPSREKIVIEVKSDESYYAGFFRACEMLIHDDVKGIYSQIDNANMAYEDQCIALVQEMMDLNAASVYSQNWPGIKPLVLADGKHQYKMIPH